MINLGQRIRNERQAKGWSLKKLSGLIDVSIMTLQRIETGKVSPSVTLLTEIAYQLGLPVTEFVRDKNRVMVHLKRNDLPMDKDDLGSSRCLFPENTVAEGLSVWVKDLEPGGVVDWASGRRYEGAHILDGNAEVEFDDRKVRLQAGETIYFDARFRQRVKSNNGVSAVVILKG